MSKIIKNLFFKAWISDDGQTLGAIDIFRPNKKDVLDFNDFKQLKDIKYIGTGERLFGQRTSTRVNELVLPKGAIKVGARAFECSTIKSVVWPDDCRDIEFKTFYESGIKRLSNIDRVDRIEDFAFANSEISSFCVPDGVKHIPVGCFYNAVCLEEITNTEHLEYVGEVSFTFTSIKEFHWPSQCKTIKHRTFDCCRTLSQIDNIQDVEEIEETAFSECAFPVFYFPEKCQHVRTRSFSRCRQLKEFYGLDHVFTIEGSAFYSSGITDVDLTNSTCYSIGALAFGHSDLQNFKAGYFLREVDDSAFSQTAYYTNLKNRREENYVND